MVWFGGEYIGAFANGKGTFDLMVCTVGADRPFLIALTGVNGVLRSRGRKVIPALVEAEK